MNLFEEVKKRADALEVIGRYVSLKREGSSYKGLCPFHPDRNPSFSLVPEKGLWKCFGCGKGGDVIRFVALMEGISNYEAALKLAKELGIKVEKEVKNPYARALALVRDFYFESLKENKEAKEYLLKVRKIPAAVIKEFKVGFSPGKEAVEFAKREGIFDVLLELGHFKEGKDGPFDLFRSRITLPISDAFGKVRGFGGRALGNQNPKYVNSPSGEWFKKELSLFGIERAAKRLKDKRRLIFVEGFFDVLRLHSLGFGEAIGLMGTALTDGHVAVLTNLLKREGLSKKEFDVFLFFDGDEAGRERSEEAANKLLEAGFTVRIVQTPEGEDPDTFGLKEGYRALKELLNKAQRLKPKKGVKTGFYAKNLQADKRAPKSPTKKRKRFRTRRRRRGSF